MAVVAWCFLPLRELLGACLDLIRVRRRGGLERADESAFGERVGLAGDLDGEGRHLRRDVAVVEAPLFDQVAVAVGELIERLEGV